MEHFFKTALNRDLSHGGFRMYAVLRRLAMERIYNVTGGEDVSDEGGISSHFHSVYRDVLVHTHPGVNGKQISAAALKQQVDELKNLGIISMDPWKPPNSELPNEFLLEPGGLRNNGEPICRPLIDMYLASTRTDISHSEFRLYCILWTFVGSLRKLSQSTDTGSGWFEVPRAKIVKAQPGESGNRSSVDGVWRQMKSLRDAGLIHKDSMARWSATEPIRIRMTPTELEHRKPVGFYDLGENSWFWYETTWT